MQKILLVIVCLSVGLFADVKKGFYRSVSAGIGQYRYTEPGLMRIYDTTLSIDAELGYVNSSNLLKTSIQGSGNIGMGTYTGRIVNMQTGAYKPHTYSTFDSFFDAEIKEGINLLKIFNARNHTLFLNAGVGYWYFRDDKYDVPRSQEYFYIPVGIDGEFGLTSRWNLTYLADFKFLILGKNRTLLTRAYWSKDLKVDQKNGYGAKLALGLSYKHSRNQKSFVRLVARHWNIDDSELLENVTYANSAITQTFYEPKNHTQTISLQYGWEF
ncbi:hypothetical protein CCZ01_00280 [Helicobacter monodelphidis]|uniref:hypothetical protein n=1 Tax=Helicobacter sp. 15-1451 TaxID=2004995 RepID=UPI000DCDCB89|nr:hypothetical protein [Helicobacter sp. 15-1451]RAX59216.1 hypothetical protein CCZ01_00280 [Helicobacter sp. 15-1451]